MKEYEESWLNNAYSEYLRKDIFLFWRKINYPLWELFKLTKFRWLTVLIGDIQITQAERIERDWEEANAPYDEILIDCFEKMVNIIKNNNLCELLENVKFKNIRGLDFFNAMAFPCFGENLLAVNTGLFFFSHTLVRSTEVLLKAKNEDTKLSRILEKLLFNQFEKTSLAIICKDHSKTFFKIRFIASNDSLLTGIEMFCIAHEYAHLLFRKINYEYNKLNFECYYNSDIMGLILSNEEIAADAFAIIILKCYQSTLSDYSIALYLPQFLFRNFDNFDEINGSKKSVSHPSNFDRYNYIKKMINNSKYDIYDSGLNFIWSKRKRHIVKKYDKYKNKYNKTISIWNEILAIIREDIERNISSI
jgi:hypothetical protein